MKVQQTNLYHLLEHDEQWAKPAGFPSNGNFYGTITEASVKQMYRVKFDDLLVGMMIVKVGQPKISVTQPGEDEGEQDN